MSQLEGASLRTGAAAAGPGTDLGLADGTGDDSACRISCEHMLADEAQSSRATLKSATPAALVKWVRTRHAELYHHTVYIRVPEHALN